MENTINPNDIDVKDLPQYLDKNLLGELEKRDGVVRLIEELPKLWSYEQVTPDCNDSTKSIPQRLWELIGVWYMQRNRFFEAITVFNELYEFMLQAQQAGNYRAHKGMPLLWIGECYGHLRYFCHQKRYLMYTLIEDALTYEGNVNPDVTGSYFRLVWLHGIPGNEFNTYAETISEIAQKNPSQIIYPEWVLQELDQKWMVEFPTINELSHYHFSKSYIDFLCNQLGTGDGKILERLGNYLLSCVPGFRVTTRKKSPSTDYDLVCSIEGPLVDFRSELGSYFICECKDWKKAADYTTIAKFCRVLDSTKTRFGILFSTNGISGKGKAKHADREIIKAYQDRGVVIICIDKSDIDFIKDGGNFVTLLRERYEKVRLDLN